MINENTEAIIDRIFKIIKPSDEITCKNSPITAEEVKYVLDLYHSQFSAVPDEKELKIHGLTQLLKFADCPQVLIDNPALLNWKDASDEDMAWAKKEINKFKQSSPSAVEGWVEEGFTLDGMLDWAENNGWVWNKSIWMKDGWRSRNSQDLYAEYIKSLKNKEHGK